VRKSPCFFNLHTYGATFKEYQRLLRVEGVLGPRKKDGMSDPHDFGEKELSAGENY